MCFSSGGTDTIKALYICPSCSVEGMLISVVLKLNFSHFLGLFQSLYDMVATTNYSLVAILVY